MSPVCSSCHNELKPIVVFDIDGTLGEWHQHFIQFCTWFLGRNFLGSWAFYGKEELHEFMGISLETYREAKLAFRQGGYKRTMPATPGARQAVENAHTLGCEVWIATTRPYLRYDNIDKDTRVWLARNDMDYEGLVYADDKFDMLSQSVDLDRVIALVDDLPRNAERAQELGMPAVLLNRPHNEYRTDLPRVQNMQIFSELVSDRVQQWTDERGNK